MSLATEGWGHTQFESNSTSISVVMSFSSVVQSPATKAARKSAPATGGVKKPQGKLLAGHFLKN